MKVKLKLKSADRSSEAMEEAPQVDEKPAMGLVVIHGALGLLLLTVGIFFPVHWGLQHPAVVKQAAGKARESVVEFAQRVVNFGENPDGSQKPDNRYLHPARLTVLAAKQIGEQDGKILESLEKRLKEAGEPPLVTNFLLTPKGQNRYRRDLGGKLTEGVSDILHVWKARTGEKPVRPGVAKLENYYPVILLTAWLHHHHKLGQMSPAVVEMSRTRNLAGLHQFYMAMGTMADRLDMYQLVRLTNLMPDVDTFSRLSHIALVQTLLPPFHSIGNNSDKLEEDEKEHVIAPGELKGLPLEKYFNEINTTNHVAGVNNVTLGEWVEFGKLPMEITSFPITYTAVTWPGTPEGARQVVDYLMKHGLHGGRDLERAMRHGRGALLHLVRSTERISPRGSDSAMAAMAAFSLNHPRTAGLVRLVLTVLGGALLLRLFTLLNPITLADSRSVALYRWRRRATALALLILLVIIGEPVLFQSAASSEYDVAVKLPIVDPEHNQEEKPMLAVTASNTNDTIFNLVMIALFLAVQIIVYLTCLNKIREIRDCDQSPQQKLRLLENEDNLFDLGLYIGIAGTALGLGLIMLGLFTKPYSAYVSNIMGIACVAIVKIKHLRDTRQQLLEEANEADPKSTI